MAAAAAVARLQADRRVLVVEDDQAIGELLSDLLSGLGLEAVEVRTDREAYDLLSGLLPFSAIVVDVNLGMGTTGFDVARFARRIIPGIAVIYVSGEASQASFEAFGVRDSAFVAKPFTSDELLEAVRSRLPH